MPPIKRSAEDAALNLEEAPPAKRRRDSASEQSFQFESLPVELQLEAIRKVAHQPNRVQARKDLAALWQTGSKTIRTLISETSDIKECAHALGRHRGVESRLVAVCLDVKNGISAKDALRQNGPLPNVDKTNPADVGRALKSANYQHLADLAGAFSARQGSAIDEKLLKAVAGHMAYEFAVSNRLSELNIEQSATFARVFSRNTTHGHSMYALRGLGETVQRYNLVSQANIQQIAVLADAFGTKDGQNYAERVVSSQPQPTVLQQTALAQEAERFNTVANEVIETLASHVSTRGDELMRAANPEHHDTRPELLNTMKQVFDAHDSPVSRSAVEKIDALVRNLNPNNRPQLEERDRSRSPIGR